VERKLELRRMIGRFSGTSRLQYADHIEETGTELFRHVCELDLEGIIAKPKHSPYEREPARTSWYKIKNRSYSQMVGRHELFDDSSQTYTRAVRPKPSPADLLPDCAAGVSEVSRFSCLKFLGVSGVFDYAGLGRSSRYRACSCCLPRITKASASGLHLFGAEYPPRLSSVYASL
jgi:hypothetical protein